MILSLDIATSTGIAVGNPGGKPRAWSEHLGKTDDERFSQMLVLTARLIEEHKPRLVVVERPAAGDYATALLAGLAACARGVAFNRGCEVQSLAANSVRKHFLGKALTARDFPALSRAAAKRAIKAQVQHRCKILGWGDLDDDAADAAAMWDLACAKAGAQTVPAGGMFRG